MHRIHINGASGTGTTTLGRALAAQLAYPHFDADDYFWLPVTPPYTVKREVAERNGKLRSDLQANPSWVLSGSIDGWKSGAEQLITLVIFLYVPQGLRIERLRERESREFGDAIKPGGVMHAGFEEFIAWAGRYDTAGMEQRSLARHEAWHATVDCPVLRIEGDTTTSEGLKRVVSYLDSTGALPAKA
jgi:adenylate kinase family enzyme